MPTNQIKIEYEQGEVKFTVWEANGIEHDCSDIFKQVADLTAKTGQNTDISLIHGQNALTANVKFEADKKELACEVGPAVIQQILQMKA
ncbi:hypothetical protein LCGC14_1832420 [marine sediment metagenome]|uniref:Uncharacterized protein n=1 Tax=marine sediment metagenome TaxID=412755 RepID=A0A0F9H3R8_9ZZZZ